MYRETLFRTRREEEEMYRETLFRTRREEEEMYRETLFRTREMQFRDTFCDIQP